MNLDELSTPSNFEPTINVSIYSDSTVELLWNRPGDYREDAEISGFEIYRNGDPYALVSNVYNFLDDTLDPQTEYVYFVRALSNSNAPGPFSNSVVVSTGNRNITDGNGADGYTPPARLTEPTGVTAIVYGATSAELFWDRAPDTVFGYEIRRNGEFVRFTNGNSVFFDDLQANTKHVFDVIAINSDRGDIGGVASVEVALGDAPQCR